MIKKIIVKKIVVFTFLLMVVLVNVNSVFAQDTLKNLNTSANKAYTGDEKTAPSGNVSKNLPELIGTIIGTALSYLGVIFMIIMIYGGFMWMTAVGDDAKVKKAKDLIEAAIIGLIIIMSAYAITAWVGKSLTTG